MEDDFCWETDFQVLLAGKKEKKIFLEMFLKALNSWRFDEFFFENNTLDHISSFGSLETPGSTLTCSRGLGRS